MAATASPETLSIRGATAADAPVILRHRRNMFYDMGHTDEAKLQRMLETAAPLLEQWLASGMYRAWLVTTAEGKVVAGGGIIDTPWFSRPNNGGVARLAMILNVYVEPDYRRRGLARLLMETMIAWCRAQGLKTISLHASAEGRPLYEQLGFKPTNEMQLML